MLISIASLPFNSGYNGANYDFYIEASNGKWSEYLYRMSPTGTRALIYSKANFTESFGGPEVGPGYVKLRLNLDSINSPSIYGLSFYTSKSLQSNEVRDFTAWVAVPPHDIDVVTNPKDMAIRQGEELLIPPKIFNTFSNAVTSIKFFNGKNTSIKFFNSSGLTVYIEKLQPPLLKVKVSPQTPVGVYTVPFTASLLIRTTDPNLPTFNDTATGSVDPEFQVSKKYPTTGNITGLANLTIRVLPPLTVNEQFTGFWGSYGQVVTFLGAGLVGSFTTVLIDRLKNRKKHKE
jgi:hypothetical protein